MILCSINEFFNNKDAATEEANKIMSLLNIDDFRLDIKRIDDTAFVVIARLKKLDENEANLIEANINKQQP